MLTLPALRPLAFSLLMCFGLAPHSGVFAQTTAPKTLQEQTAKLSLQAGFIDLYRDLERGRVLLNVKQLNTPFILTSSLPYGLGSNDIGLDRGQPSEIKMVHFEKRGNRLFLVHENQRFKADSKNIDESASVVQAFASSVMWAGDILASEADGHLIDFSSFLVSDWHGVINRLRDTKQGAYRVDEKRSAVLPEVAKNFPDNTELEALISFQGAGEGEFVKQAVADASTISLRQHISLVRLPDDAFVRRSYHPASGGNSVSYLDFATPLADAIDVRWQVRFRLEKTNPNAARSTVKKPIVFYVDRGAPEPVRSALMEGANWWKSAFEKAGFIDAYRVELLPEGVDPMDIRYNVIQWVHRATRGWSYGASMIDPRSGELIKGSVMLGSQRVRQDILIAESLLAPYSKTARAEVHKVVEKMALDRLRQLAAHETGHSLGIAHNFATSLQGNGSVMDYPHPLVKLNAKGEVDLHDAYGIGVGPWDDFVVAHLYGQFGANQDKAQEQAALAALRASVKAKNFSYMSDADSRADGNSHPDAALWDFGADPLKSWDQIMAVRKQAIHTFSIDVLPDARQTGELEARLVPVYLLHRFQAASLAHLIGGGSYEYGVAGDVRNKTVKAGVSTVNAATQAAALARLSDSLRAEQLALPANLLDQLTPPSMGFSRNREYFANRMLRVFDALSAVEAAAAHSTNLLLNPERINRVYWQQARDPKQLGVPDMLATLLDKTWKRAPVAATLPAGEAVQIAANWVVLDGVLNLLDSGKLHPQVAAQVQQATRELAQWLMKHPGTAQQADSRKEAADQLQRYLADPQRAKPRSMPPIPPGEPI